MKNKIVGRVLRLQENGGEEFGCEHQATIMKWGNATFWAGSKSASGDSGCGFWMESKCFN